MGKRRIRYRGRGSEQADPKSMLVLMSRKPNGRPEQKTFEHRKLRRASKRVMQGTRVGTGKHVLRPAPGARPAPPDAGRLAEGPKVRAAGTAQKDPAPKETG